MSIECNRDEILKKVITLLPAELRKPPGQSLRDLIALTAEDDIAAGMHPRIAERRAVLFIDGVMRRTREKLARRGL